LDPFHPTHIQISHICLDWVRRHSICVRPYGKEALAPVPKYHNAVNDISFNQTGTKLAVGVSYGWEKGESATKLSENTRVSVFIREIGDEVKVGSLRCDSKHDIDLYTLSIKPIKPKAKA